MMTFIFHLEGLIFYGVGIFRSEKEPQGNITEFWNGVKKLCNGLPIRLSSRCCQDDRFIPCPKPPCTSSAIVSTTAMPPTKQPPNNTPAPIKSAVAFVPKAAITTARAVVRAPQPPAEDQPDFEIINIPLNPPQQQPIRAAQQTTSKSLIDNSQVIFPDD
jgi:hypothetical protein